MAVYAITGKLGSGKGKAAIDQIRCYLRAGKRVATNCDVFLEHLMPQRDKSAVLRVPDKPSAVDLYMIGSGNRFVQFDPILRYSRDAITAIAPSPRLLSGAYSTQTGHLFRRKLDTRSSANWTPVPRQTGHLRRDGAGSRFRFYS